MSCMPRIFLSKRCLESAGKADGRLGYSRVTMGITMGERLVVLNR